MYYNAPPPQSPGIAHKLQSHHDQNPWSRHIPLGAAGPSAPPSQPGAYTIYTNGTGLHHHPHTHPPLHHQHHHQNSLSHAAYPSPPTVHPPPIGAQLSPSTSTTNQQPFPAHWQQQLLKYEMVRASRSPHHRARASAMTARTVTNSAVAITNPNAKLNGTLKEPDLDTPGGARAADHPSSTVAPVQVESNRPSTHTTAPPPQSTWNSIDMGGVNIKHLPGSNGLFKFTFVVNLYLNHNALNTIPPEIAHLRHLVMLDLSANLLTTLPPELGMLTMLKELFLFDNQITSLPYELGTLHQLQTLGIEGNPLEHSLKQIIQQSGTPALISWLRDKGPIPPDPPERPWQYLTTQAERQLLDSDPSVERFKLLSWNILCERCATEQLYGYTPSWALAWDWRKERIMEQITHLDCDFMCLQEVDIRQYEELFSKQFEQRGYEGVYYPKSRYKTMNEVDRRLVDGCAIFYKSAKYQLVEHHLLEFSPLAMQRPDFKKTDDMFNRVLGQGHIAVVVLLENKQTGTRFIIANAHIAWDPNFCDVKLVQTALLMDEVDKFATNFARYPPRPPSPSATGTPKQYPSYSDGTKIPLIVCGDYNSVPGSGVYEFITTGSLPPDHPDFLGHTYGNYTTDGVKHKYNLKSAYADIGELPLTNFTSAYQGSIDYIWHSTNSIATNAILGEIDPGYLSKCVGFPNVHFPSDHILIASDFRIKPPKAEPPISRPAPPTFPSSSSRT